LKCHMSDRRGLAQDHVPCNAAIAAEENKEESRRNLFVENRL